MTETHSGLPSPTIGCADVGIDAILGPWVATACFLNTREHRAAKALLHEEFLSWTERKLENLARKIRSIVPYEVVSMNPTRLNGLLKKKEMTPEKLRAWLLAKACSGMLKSYPQCPAVESASFSENIPVAEEMRGAGGATEWIPLKTPGDTVSAACAWILARAEHARKLRHLAEEAGISLPSQGPEIMNSTRMLYERGGMSTLRKYAQLHHPFLKEFR